MRALYYWCSQHSGMGGAINTNSTFGSSNFDGSVQSTVSRMHQDLVLLNGQEMQLQEQLLDMI